MQGENQMHAAGGSPGGYGGYDGGGGGGYAPPPGAPGAPGGYGPPGGPGGPPGGGGPGGPPGGAPWGAQPTVSAQPTPGSMTSSAHPPAKSKSPIGLIIGLVVALGLVGGGAYAAIWYFGGASPVLAKYMPKDTQAYFEVPSVTKVAAKFLGSDVIDSKEIDTDKQMSTMVDGLVNAFDMKKDDASSLIKSVNGVATGMRKTKKDGTQEITLLSFGSTDPVDALLKTSRFSKGDKLGGGQGYELKERDIAPDKMKDMKPVESSLSFTSFKGDHKVLVWFSDKKILAWGSKDMVEESGKLMGGSGDSLASNDKFKNAKFESGSVALGWFDSDLVADKDDDSMADVKKKVFDGIDPFVVSGRIASGGMVVTLTGNLKGKAIPDEKLIPEPGKITLQEKLPKTTVGYLATSNGNKVDPKDAKKAMVDFMNNIDKTQGKDFEKNLDKLDDVIGVSYETMTAAIGGEMIIGVNATSKIKFDKDMKTDEFQDEGGAELIARAGDKDAAAKVIKALKEKLFEGALLKDTFDVKKEDEGFLATMTKGPAIQVKVDLRDGCIAVFVGSKKRVGDMVDAFDGKGDTLKSDKAHKLAIGSLDTKPVALIWVDTGRILKDSMTDDMKSAAKDAGFPIKALKLDGDERITSALAIETKAKDGGISYRLETLNVVAVGAIAAGVGMERYMSLLGGRRKTEFSPPPDMPTMGGGDVHPTGDGTGIPECDAYLAKIETCSALSSMKANLPQMKDSFRQAATSGMGDMVKDSCTKGIDAVKSVCP